MPHFYRSNQSVLRTLLATAMMLSPVGVLAQDSGEGTLRFSLPASNSAEAQSRGAAAAQAANPYDYGHEEVVAAPTKHWTEMSAEELVVEIARTDTDYSPLTRKAMATRLEALEGKLSTVEEKTEQSVSAPVAEKAETKKKEEAAPAVVVLPGPTTPWWKLPKNQRAAARAAQRSGGAVEEVKEEDMTPRERIYNNIQRNRGR